MMRTCWIRWSALGALMALVISTASAQLETASARVRAGAYFPSDVDLQAYNKTWFAVGLTIAADGVPLLGSSATELSFDLFTHQTGGSRGTVTSILATQVYEQPIGDGDTLLQLRFGAGLYVVDTVGPSKNLFGGRVGLTLRLNETYSVELNYDITDRFGPNRDRANGFSLTVGFQF
ncbi:MAG: outer membrane beta-barrel protein [Fimbriimonadales bacterium]|nr:outer membrane beta-barrel protein [Fimbriimonadales bacterium]